MAPTGPKAPAWRHWLGIALRTLHIAGVCLLAASLLGAGGIARHGAWLTLASGIALFASELADRRVRVGDFAGLVVVLKLALVAWMAWRPAAATALFWVAVAVSSVASHAPRRVRHWRPGSG
jgi:hypothetical protein